jgi:class 3 adenylate cyclase/tetratricopeptide (TPR) repeat protein
VDRAVASRAYAPKHLPEKTLTSRAAVEGERKQVTVLFADLQGSMELLADRDPEDARAVLDPVLDIMMEAIHRYEGTVNQVMGDGIMALFGAPLAQEDHGLRACYAALRMQEAVKRHADEVQRTVGLPIQIRIGLNSGEVVVRSIGNDLHMDYTAVGQTTHLAARMEQMAMAGSILMTATTLALTDAWVTVRELGMIPIRGMAERVGVFELSSASRLRSRLHATAGRGLTRFVGRERELAGLARALDEAAAGRGQVVAVVGEPGIGKSRLCYEFLHSRHTQGWLICETGAAPHGNAIPYLPIIELLKGYLGIDARDDARAVQEKVAGKLLALDRRLLNALSPLLALLDVSVDDAEWQALDPPQRRRRTLDAITHLLLRESVQQPVLFVFEDLQWVDSETRAVLDALIARSASARVLLIVNYRPEYEHSWFGHKAYTECRIEPLAPASSEELLEALLGHDASTRPLKRLLIGRTEGNPFFLEESVRTLIETGVVVLGTGGYRVEREVTTMHVPPTVQAVLASRIDRLTPDEKQLLQSAAVTGKDVPFVILQEIADLSDDALRGALANLQAAGFLYQTRLFPDLEYTFKHALTHDVAYGGLLLDRRRALHGRILRAIEELYGGRLGEYAEVLAHHAVLGALWDKAVGYLRQAASQAASRSAHHVAVTHLEQAIAALGHLPESPDKNEVAIDLRFALRNSLFGLGKHAQTFSYLMEAEALARGLDDEHRLGWVSCYLMMHSLLKGQYERIIGHGEHALAVGRKLDQLPLRVVASLGIGQAYHAMGRYRHALDALREAVAPLHGPLVSERFGMNSPPSVACYTWMAWACAERGEFSAGFASGKEGIRVAEAVNEPWSLASARFGIGLVHLLQGEFREAVVALESGLELARRFELRTWLPPLASALGHAHFQSGDMIKALALLEDAVEQATSMGLVVRHSLRVCWLGEGYLKIGRAADASATAQRALQLARDHGERGYEAWAMRLLGLVAAQCGAADAAETYGRQALVLAGELEMLPLIARSRLDLGVLAVERGRTTEASLELTKALELFDSLQMPVWSQRTATVLLALR